MGREEKGNSFLEERPRTGDKDKDNEGPVGNFFGRILENRSGQPIGRPAGSGRAKNERMTRGVAADFQGNRAPLNYIVLLELARNDFRMKYLGSHLGIIWAFAQPTANVLVLWFVVRKALGLSPVENFPYVLWLVAGIIPWYFFSDCVNNATHAVVGNSHLVKKVVFQVGTLPLIKILSALIIHLVFLGILVVLLALYGHSPTVHAVQAVYYLAASVVLLLGISWLTSSVIVFVRDIGPVIGLGLQLLFWITPIFWSLSGLSPRTRFLLKLNPLAYIVEGYRDAFINRVWFWERGALSLYFWAVAVVVFVAGALVFRRLRPHFADVL